DYLLRRVQQESAVPWQSLREWNQYLIAQRNGAQYVVAFDDLQSAPQLDQFLQMFKSLVSDHTELESFRWLVTLEHTAYAEVTIATTFWRTYGFAQGDSSRSTVSSPLYE